IGDVQGATPIHYAYRFGKDEQMFKLFSLNPERLKLKTVDNKTPLDIAAEFGHINIVKNYLDNTINQGSVRSLIDAAASYRGYRVLSYLLPDTNKDLYAHVLHLACRQAHGHELMTDKNIFSYLDTKDAMSGHKSRDGFTRLMVAVK
ncbi:unnamed protein product, partial [Rotaria sp. Silwood1]